MAPELMADDKKARKPAEQRLSDRVWIGAPATLRLGEEELSAFVEVINLGGMYVATARVPELGDYVELNFSLPEDPRGFRVRGNVVYLNPAAERQRAGFGARFERAPVGLLEAIKGLNRGH
ncbi:MAG TPA: PilZ domain-containing protein [Thermoanaerobaculia bacterium]|nr:PilZ domain-containing protein [Thermoanaerobaculia bacterium]